MAAVLRRPEPGDAVESAPAAQPAAVRFEAAAGVMSPARALQVRLASAFGAPPAASPVQIAAMGITVVAATWLSGVLLYATL